MQNYEDYTDKKVYSFCITYLFTKMCNTTALADRATAMGPPEFSY